ncbi:serpin-like protein [Lymphocystis disease virus 3]|uniref:Serpin-like protein n=1 Tax=Lymphocystis disease virus 3 TaxID=2560566 RepID=A0A1B2RVV3_9VIRU|nr:serpin-like protein [Lymphocystis disease virus Sa]AOC55134.1 serpin-like protein [Lymphocystis disease virus 3]
MLSFTLNRLPKNNNSCMSPMGLDHLTDTLSAGTSAVKKYVSTRIFVSPMYFDFWKKSEDVRELDFSKRYALEIINDWVNDSTQGKITTIYDDIPSYTKAIIANAVYFKACWKTPFEDSFKQPFHLSDGSTVNVETMMCKGVFMVSEDLSVIKLPYKNSQAFMIISLTGTEDCLKLCTTFKFVCLTLPKFTFQKEYDLTDAFKDVYLKAFTPNYNNELCVVNVKQKTYIKVDEEGTEAVAVTGLLVADCCTSTVPEHILKIDRPFYYFIVEKEDVLFVGKCVDPRIN